jgi:CDK5 regulatory subunit-associated protein 3
MAQQVKYEIPNLKKFLQNGHKQLSDTHNKIRDSRKKADRSEAKFHDTCADLKIAGKNIKAEVRASAWQLTRMMLDIERTISQGNLEKAHEYYVEFTRHQLASSFPEDAKYTQPAIANAARLCSRIHDVLESAKSRQDLYDQLDEEDEKARLAAESEAAAMAADDIGGGIDWGISLEEDGTAEAAEIDWGLTIEAEDGGEEVAGDIDAVVVEDADAGDAPTISWDFEVVDDESGADSAGDNAGNTAVELDTDAVDDEARKSLLEDAKIRQGFITDLLELEAFLKQRVNEIKSQGDDPMYAVQFQEAPALLQQQTTDSIEQFLDTVADVLSSLRDSHLQMFVNIRSSDKFVDRLASNLQQDMDTALRLRSMADELEVRVIELRSSIDRSATRLSDAVAYVKELQANTENAIGKLFNNRSVNIYGDISTI